MVFGGAMGDIIGVSRQQRREGSAQAVDGAFVGCGIRGVGEKEVRAAGFSHKPWLLWGMGPCAVMVGVVRGWVAVCQTTCSQAAACFWGVDGHVLDDALVDRCTWGVMVSH
jgi:hypothetical protein